MITGIWGISGPRCFQVSGSGSGQGRWVAVHIGSARREKSTRACVQARGSRNARVFWNRSVSVSGRAATRRARLHRGRAMLFIFCVL